VARPRLERDWIGEEVSVNSEDPFSRPLFRLVPAFFNYRTDPSTDRELTANGR
jgi:hypothetical protein